MKLKLAKFLQTAEKEKLQNEFNVAVQGDYFLMNNKMKKNLKKRKRSSKHHTMTYLHLALQSKPFQSRAFQNYVIYVPVFALQIYSINDIRFISDA